MLQVLDILKVAHRNTVDPSMNLLHMKEQFIPGSIQYVIRRYYPTQNWQNDDTGMLVYHYSAKKAEENFLELRFCISGNKYCFERSCAECSEQPTKTVAASTILLTCFLSTFLQPFTPVCT